VVAAWGVQAARLGRPKEVLGLLNSLGATPYCLRVTQRRTSRAPAAAALELRAAALRGGL